MLANESGTCYAERAANGVESGRRPNQPIVEDRMAVKFDITPELCRQLLRYDPETGKLYWRERLPATFRSDGARPPEWNCAVWNRQRAGKEALKATSHGYRHGSINGVMLQAHHVVWLMAYGAPPSGFIDHIDGDPLNNRLNNLRDVSASINSRNRVLGVNNKSGHHGVCWRERSGKWEAHIGLKDGQKFLGMFKTKEEAVAARLAAEKANGFHANHGRMRA